MLSSVDFGALSHGPERVHETPLALGLRGLDQVSRHLPNLSNIPI